MQDGVIVAHFKFTVFVKSDGSLNVTHHGLQGLQPTRSARIDKGKRTERHALVYCGKLPIGQENSGVRPIISSISWNTKPEAKKRATNFFGLDMLLACSGSFGTCLCFHSKSKGNSSTANVKEDLEDGWTKVLVSDAPAKLCQWAPLDKGRFLAVGTVRPHDGKSEVHLYNCTDARHKMFGHNRCFEMYHYEKKTHGLQWENTFTMLSDVGFCGISICNNHADLLICPRLDRTVWVVRVDYDLIKKKHHPSMKRLFDLEPGAVHAVWNRNVDYLVTVDKKQLIRTYTINESVRSLFLCNFGFSEMINLDLACDNANDVDCTKMCQQFDAMDWLNNRLLASGGEDGFLYFWHHQSSVGPGYFTVKRRNFTSEELFYYRMQLQYGRSKEMKKSSCETAEASAAMIKQLEMKVKKMSELANDGLEKIRRGSGLAEEEVKSLLRSIKEVDYTSE